jgi:DNA modification methylase
MKEKTLTQEVLKLDVGQVEITPVMERIYDYQNRENEIETLVTSISNEGQKQPVNVVEVDGKFVIIDGVLRYKAICRIHGVNTINVLVQPDFIKNEQDLVDLIIHNQLHKEKTGGEKLNEIKIILRIDEEDKNPKRDRETRIKLVEGKLGKGWKKNNVLTFEKLLYWVKENGNVYDLVDKIILGEVSINKVGCFLKTLERNDYDLKKEQEALILKQFLNGNINELQVNNLILVYNVKKDEPFTDFELTDVDREKFKIIVGDCKTTKLPEETKIDLVMTSIPYYQQVKYGDNEDGDLVKNEIGWEKRPEDYVKNVCETFRLNFDNIKETGVVVINVNENYKNGECVGVVPMIILEMKRNGYKYIQTTCWFKKDEKPQPNNIKRLKTNFEYCLIFTKTTDYYFNPIKIKNDKKKCRITKGCKEQGRTENTYHMSNFYDTLTGFMDEQEMLDVIKINQNTERGKRGFETNFFGDYPSLLPAFFTLIFTPENGICWDPYGGNGGSSITLQLGRRLIINELYKKNVKIIEKAVKKNLDLKDPQGLKRMNEKLWGDNEIDEQIELIEAEEVITYEDGSQIILGDNLKVLRGMNDNSCDSILTDPPYGIKINKENWDNELPKIEVWKECLRVLKPGGIMLAFGHEKTYHKLMTEIENAGFEVLGQMMWIYGRGNTGGQNLNSMKNKSELENYEGLKTKIKGMQEPIAMVRKPLEGNYIKNYRKFGTGVFFIDKCKIGEREPSNVMVSEEVGEQLRSLKPITKGSGKKSYGRIKHHPLALYDGREKILNGNDKKYCKNYNDGGGIDRYFYVPKVEGKERGEYNTHPTVKPKELIKHLVKLITPEGGICCDPFFGSGSLGLSIRELVNYKFIGIEREKKYFQISQRRVGELNPQVLVAA